MKNDFITHDRLIPRIRHILEATAESIDIDIVTILLFGSKATGDRNSMNEYEIMVLLDNETKLTKFIQYQNTLRIELLKHMLSRVKILVYTVESFEEILFEDYTVGTFLYMICKDHVILYDKNNEFVKILHKMLMGHRKKEESFLEQCIDFSRELGSEKWERKWEKLLFQYRMQKRRKEDKI